MQIDYVNALNAGAGFDTKNLVESLVNAERAPRKATIDKKMSDAQLELSGISKALAEIDALRVAAQKVNDASDFNEFAVANSQTSALTVTATDNAKSSTHSVTVSAIAAAAKAKSGTFASTTTQINGGNSFDLTISLGSTSPSTHTISVSTATPAGVVAAINEANLGITAETLQTGTSGDYVIQVIGQTGAENTFSITSPPSDLGFSSTQSAADASLTVDGISFSRASNTISDVITGSTIALHAATSGAASIGISNDTTATKDKIKDFVDAANKAISAFDNLLDRSEGGELAGNIIVRQIGREIQNFLTSTSSTPGSTVTRLSDIGISVTRQGTFSIDETTLNSAIAANYSELVTLFSANTNEQTDVGVADRGIAGDLAKYLKDLSNSSSYFSKRTAAIDLDVVKYDEALTSLETKMQSLQDRYTKQFSTMQRVVNEMNTLQDSLKSSFDNLPYNNRD